MKILQALFLLLSLTVYSQSDDGFTNDFSDNTTGDVTGTWIKSASKPGIIGTVYLYENWNLPAKVITYTKNISMNNVNFNVQTNQFEARFSKDSVLVLNPSEIKSITIGTDTYKRYRNGLSYNFYQEIGALDNKVLAKGYKLSIKKGKINPLTHNQQTADKYVKNEKFFVIDLSNNTAEEIRLKKNTVIKFIDESKSREIKNYMKKNNFDYDNEKDLKILISNFS